MAKRSWPFGVTSWDDTVKFAQLLFAGDVAFENYAERLLHRSSIEGACAEGRPFLEIRDSMLGRKCSQQQCSSNEVAADVEC